MSRFSYWNERVATAAEECRAKLTKEQIEFIAGAVQSGHENYVQSFYSPPASDRIEVIERECQAKIKAAQAKNDQIRSDFIKNVCMRRHCDPMDVTLEGGGRVTILRL
jgi:hypothetical protein